MKRRWKKFWEPKNQRRVTILGQELSLWQLSMQRLIEKINVSSEEKMMSKSRSLLASKKSIFLKERVQDSVVAQKVVF